jgi:sarcosine oxidase subunit gamma
MSRLSLARRDARDRLGLKGAQAALWLAAQGVAVPTAPNSWTNALARHESDDELLVARLGTSEFFLEGASGASAVHAMSLALRDRPAGVYPVLREDWAFVLDGEAAEEVLAQVCNVNFAARSLDSRPLIMTLMIGVAVLIVAQSEGGARRYRVWCDPSFGPCLGETLGAVVVECGGTYTGA